ncbi:phenylalanyl-tRNA synthetase, b subunit [Serratia symbiotica str. 'Cinara cedri']|nr:phenylalanyl-tRNA synthetase, b subunit [Serratia symbiotica str. 'Cinara cedri']
MKFSELWLREWVNPAISCKELSEQITMAGLEVSMVKPVAGDFHGVVIGKVIACRQHQNSKKLYITKVNIGNNRLLNIICASPNCRVGLKVAVATQGTILPGNFKVKATKLCDEISEGILCTFCELGISDDYDSIIELPQDAPIGVDIRDYLQLNDNTIEISVTPNRADCLSILGIARDISVFNHMELTKPNIIPVIATTNTTLPICVDASHKCPRYLGRVVTGLNIHTTCPLWIREKLRRCGVRPINTVVDITNYVLLELGQPMHAFDLKSVEGGIVVRMAKNSESLILLDNNKIQLNTNILVIADHHKTLAIAGVLGGKYSGINNETQDILLECALFDPLSINNGARCYNLHTESSHRYERGVDTELQYQAMERATRILLDICGGQAGPVIDVTNKDTLPKHLTIQLRRKKIDSLLGHIIPSKQISDILRRIGCQVTKQDDTWLAVPPSWRFDIKIEEDLVEEIVRIYGYNNIPNLPIYANLIMNKHPDTDLTLSVIKNLLVNHDFQEVITYSFVDPKVQALLHPNQAPLILPNPISVNMSAMRLSLWTGLLSVVTYNLNRQQTRIRLFESGLCFIPDNNEHFSIRQDIILGGVVTGNAHNEHWDIVNNPIDFYDLKGELESILELTGELSNIKFQVSSNTALHPGQSADIYLHGKHIGSIGVIHPELECQLNLHGRTIVFELQWNKITQRILPKARTISRFPANRRDIAIIVAESVAAGDILSECKKVSVNQVVGVNLFDVYRGKGIAKGYKSLGISLMLQNTARALEEEEIVTTVTKCVEALKQRFQASLRD